MKKLSLKIALLGTLVLFGCYTSAALAEKHVMDSHLNTVKTTATNHVIPEYPSSAITKQVEGHVTLSFDVNENGQPTNIDVVNFKGSKYFIRSSINALEQTRFVANQNTANMKTRYDYSLDAYAESNSSANQVLALNR